MPLVFLNMSADPHPNVSIDDDQAARRVARHLVSLGHRVFAVVGSASQHQGAFWSSDTHNGFEQEVKTLSPAAVVHHLSVPAVLAPNAAELATQSILDQTQPPHRGLRPAGRAGDPADPHPASSGSSGAAGHLRGRL